jgi:hypothetical protein
MRACSAKPPSPKPWNKPIPPRLNRGASSGRRSSPLDAGIGTGGRKDIERTRRTPGRETRRRDRPRGPARHQGRPQPRFPRPRDPAPTVSARRRLGGGSSRCRCARARSPAWILPTVRLRLGDVEQVIDLAEVEQVAGLTVQPVQHQPGALLVRNPARLQERGEPEVSI